MPKKKTLAGVDVFCSYDKAVAPEDLVPFPRNPNTHPDKQVALLAKIIRAQGWRHPIVISARSGFITKGHARREAALVLEVAKVPVEVQEYADDASEWADIVADNRIAELAETNTSTLRDLLESIDDGAVDMDLTGFDHDDLETLMTQVGDFSDLDQQNDDLAPMDPETIPVVVPHKFREKVVAFLANGEQPTAAGLGKGVMKRCGLL